MASVGCAGISLDEMKEQGNQFLNEGNEMHETLVNDSKQMNDSFFNGTIGTGWISVLENIRTDSTKNRIQLASINDIGDKSSVEDTASFINDLDLDNWTLVNEFPDELEYNYVFFIQEKISDETVTDIKYKNIANLRYFQEDGLIMITVSEGLIDLSDEFIPENNNFTSVYEVSDEVINYLLTIIKEK